MDVVLVKDHEDIHRSNELRAFSIDRMPEFTSITRAVVSRRRQNRHLTSVLFQRNPRTDAPCSSPSAE